MTSIRRAALVLFLALSTSAFAHPLGTLAPLGGGSPGPDATFLRGDSNGDGGLDLADVAATLGFIVQVYEPPCAAAVDYNSNGTLDLGDIVEPVQYLFETGAPPPPPFPSCDSPIPNSAFDCQATTCAP